MNRFYLAIVVAVSINGAACGGGTDPSGTDTGSTEVDAGAVDAGPAADADGVDAGAVDAGPAADAGGVDAGASELDGGGPELDSGPAGTDGGSPALDSGASDVDAGASDPDSGLGDLDAGGGAAPTCEITAPLDGATQDFDDDFLFIASASDPEDGALAGASIVWRSDLVVAPLGSGVSIATLLAPGTHTITCTATDSDGNTGTDAISVTSRSPVAVINHPGDGETRSATSSIPFVGLGRDFEDGSLPASALVWRSNLDGMIGTGLSFNRMLSAGTNVVTLTVTDSAGNTGTDTITLTITP